MSVFRPRLCSSCGVRAVPAGEDWDKITAFARAHFRDLARAALDAALSDVEVEYEWAVSLPSRPGSAGSVIRPCFDERSARTELREAMMMDRREGRLLRRPYMPWEEVE